MRRRNRSECTLIEKNINRVAGGNGGEAVDGSGRKGKREEEKKENGILKRVWKNAGFTTKNTSLSQKNLQIINVTR